MWLPDRWDKACPWLAEPHLANVWTTTHTKVYVLIGDGESQEGQIWEAALFAAHNNLGNLTAFTDWNRQQIDGHVDNVAGLGDLVAKWKSFGWLVLECDGHSEEDLRRAFQENTQTTHKTHDGSHAYAHGQRGRLYGEAPTPGTEKPPRQNKKPPLWRNYRKRWEIFNTTRTMENTGNKDTRSGFGAGLLELGSTNPAVVALTADLTGSVKMDAFAAAYPHRFFQCGIAEANMIGTAAGLAITGHIPFVGNVCRICHGGGSTTNCGNLSVIRQPM